jgi:hypothetical protein
MPAARIEAHLHVGDEALPSARGASADAAVAQLDFTLDGRPLGATPEWSRPVAMAGPALAACLAGLPRGEERLLVSLGATRARHEVLAEGQRIEVRVQDAAYLRFALGRDAASYAYLASGDEDSRASELIVEVEKEWIDELVTLGWDWYSFRAYVGEHADSALLRELVACEDPDRRRGREFERFACVVEDWADGTAMRISSKLLSAPEIIERVDMDAVNRALLEGP